MNQHRTGRLIGLVVMAALLGPISPGPALATTATPAPRSIAAAGTSPWTLLGTPAGQRYATGTPSEHRILAARPSGGRAGGTTTRPVAGAGHPDAATIRPFAAPSPVPATSSGAPDNHQAGFTGLAESDQPKAGSEPANSTIAVGPEQVVQVANMVMRITDRSGTPQAADIPIPSFFVLPSGFFDAQPRVIYDSLHGRFVATETSWDCNPDPSDPGGPVEYGHGYLDLAVSVTNDPTGRWNLFFWRYNDRVPQDPSIGTSTDKLALSDNLAAMTQGDGGSGDGSCAAPATLAPYAGDVLIANWSDLLANDASSPIATEFATSGASGPLTYGTRAASQVPATSPTLYVVARATAVDPELNVDAVGDVIVTAFTGTTTKTLPVSVAGSWDLTNDGIVAPFGNPADPHQPGSPATIANGVDGFTQDALWQAGRLTWATTYPCTPSGDTSQRDCVRLTQVATTDSPSTEPTAGQDFLLARSGFDSYLPGIGLAGDGTLDIVYSQSGSSGSNYVSSYQQYQRRGDAANTISPPVRLAAGTSTYAGASWGAYLGLGQDSQVGAAVWQANASSGAAGWTTFVDQLGTTAAATYVAIGPVRIVDSRDGSGLSSLAGKFSANVARTFQVAGLGPIPANAVAVTGNLTVTRQTAAGYVALTPDPTNTPGSSTLNFPVGDNRANNVTIPLSAQGRLSAVYKAVSGKTTDLVFDVTGYFVTGAGQATYLPIPPFRALDSRSGTGQPGDLPAKFLAGVPQTFTIGDGVTIPTTATAITGNLTVTNQTRAGYLSISPDPPPGTPGSSNLNFPVGDNRANGFAARLNTSGQLSIVYVAVAGASTDVVLDITGYFGPGLTGGLSYYPLNPGRVMDTRTGVANSGLTGAFSASVARTLSIGAHWGVPADAGAVTGNLTVTGQTSAGFVAMTPDPTTSPTTSTLNFPAGDNRANGVFGPLDSSGDASFVYKAPTGKTTQLILDVTGYFR